jgi:hypothetical protein
MASSQKGKRRFKKEIPAWGEFFIRSKKFRALLTSYSFFGIFDLPPLKKSFSHMRDQLKGSEIGKT